MCAQLKTERNSLQHQYAALNEKIKAMSEDSQQNNRILENNVKLRKDIEQTKQQQRKLEEVADLKMQLEEMKNKKVVVTSISPMATTQSLVVQQPTTTSPFHQQQHQHHHQLFQQGINELSSPKSQAREPMQQPSVSPNSSRQQQVQQQQLLVSLVVVPDSAIVKHCSTDAYFFLWFQRQLIVYCIICGAITMAVLLPIYFMSTDIDIYQDFASTTVASLHLRQNPLAFVQLAITIGFPLVGCIFLWRVRRLARSVIKPNANFASLFSAMISGLSPDVKNKNELKAYFAERYGRDSVADVNIIYELNKLKRLVEKKEEATKNLAYYEKQYEKSRKRPTIQNGCCGYPPPRYPYPPPQHIYSQYPPA